VFARSEHEGPGYIGIIHSWRSAVGGAAFPSGVVNSHGPEEPPGPADHNGDICAGFVDGKIRLREFDPARAFERAAVKTSDSVPRKTVEYRESATGQNSAIGLNGKRSDKGVRAGAEVDARIDRTIRIQSHDTIFGDTVEAGEITAEKDVAIEL